MGPWGPNMPVTPDDQLRQMVAFADAHGCVQLCCSDEETCTCECTGCDCRYAERMGS